MPGQGPTHYSVMASRLFLLLVVMGMLPTWNLIVNLRLFKQTSKRKKKKKKRSSPEKLTYESKRIITEQYRISTAQSQTVADSLTQIWPGCMPYLARVWSSLAWEYRPPGISEKQTYISMHSLGPVGEPEMIYLLANRTPFKGLSGTFQCSPLITRKRLETENMQSLTQWCVCV